MTTDLRAQLSHDPVVQDFASRVRDSGMGRSFVTTIDGDPCPLFVDSIRRGYPQKGGTIGAPPKVIAQVVIELAFETASVPPTPVGGLRRL